MKKTFLECILIAVLLLALTGCANRSAESTAPAPVPQATVDVRPVPTEAVAAPSEAPSPTPARVRQDGERFDAVIMLEGMEETVHYEHIRNESLGIEMDYDYESFVRVSEPDRERFISVWDDVENPENYLELIYSPESAEAVTAFVSEALSREYDIITVPRELDYAGTCTRIEASVIRGTNNMADQIQAVYIIPAQAGCIVATTHSFIAESEGFGHRFDYMLNGMRLIDTGDEQKLTDDQALAAIRNYCISSNPGLERIAAEGYSVYWELSSSDEREIVVLFRSYTGALVRYYIDRSTGDTYVTEFVPGIPPEEERTEESLNVWDYLG